jgi:uncharacterized coiled-coil protein SlyX
MGTENERLAVIETEIKSQKEDIHLLFKETNKINVLDTTIAVLTTSMDEVKKAVEKLTEKLDKVSEAPIKEKAKNWDATLKWIFGIVAGIIGGVALTLILGK